MSEEYKRGTMVRITKDYDVFDTNVNGMIGKILRPYSVNRIEKNKHSSEKIVKHLVYIAEIDEYCEPREEWLEKLTKESD